MPTAGRQLGQILDTLEASCDEMESGAGWRVWIRPWCAVTFPGAHMLEQEAEPCDALCAANVRARYSLTKTLLPAMIERGGGRVVNISAHAIRRADVGLSVYSSTKAALVSSRAPGSGISLPVESVSTPSRPAPSSPRGS